MVAPPNGRIPATDLDLPEHRAVRGDHDVAREHQFDAEGEARALHRNHDGFRELFAGDLPRVDPTLGNAVEAVSADARTDVGKVEPSSEMITVGENETDPKLGIAFERPVRKRQFVQHPQVCGVALVHPVEADQQDVTVTLHGDPGRGGCVDVIGSHTARLRAACWPSKRDEPPVRPPR